MTVVVGTLVLLLLLLLLATNVIPDALRAQQSSVAPVALTQPAVASSTTAAPQTTPDATPAKTVGDAAEAPAAAPAGMVAVPAGPFTMGGVNGQFAADETPPRVITLGSFYIDTWEVTNVQFARFADGAGYQTDAEKAGDSTTWRTYNTPDRQKFPVTYVSWSDAAHYCGWVGKRLPTEAEWEKAARDNTKHIYPWGDVFNGDFANTFELGAGQPVAVAGHSTAGPYGAYDMAGNVWEWVQDWYQGDYYAVGPKSNPTGPATGSQKVIRGGSFKSIASRATTSVRGRASPDGRGNDIGFRCAKSAQ